MRGAEEKEMPKLKARDTCLLFQFEGERSVQHHLIQAQLGNLASHGFDGSPESLVKAALKVAVGGHAYLHTSSLWQS